MSGIVRHLLQLHQTRDFRVNQLLESGNWTIGTTRAYKRGLKKYQRDQRVMQAQKQLLDFIKSHSGLPAINSFPPELNVHRLKQDSRFPANTLWAHLKGQKVGLVFSLDQNQINLLAMGTHDDMGWR